jgi:hypothetical protein
MTLFVHIAPEGVAKRIRRNGIQARRMAPDPANHPEHRRVVWAFPVLPSYTLTYSWGRELKRSGAKTLAAAVFRLAEDAPVYVRHYTQAPRLVTAAEALDIIRAQADPRGYEIMVPRRIEAREIVRVHPLPRAIGWRYMPDAKAKAASIACDCPVCVPRGAIKRRRYLARIRAKSAGA